MIKCRPTDQSPMGNKFVVIFSNLQLHQLAYQIEMNGKCHGMMRHLMS